MRSFSNRNNHNTLPRALAPRARREGLPALALASVPAVLLIGLPIAALLLHQNPAHWIERLSGADARRALLLTIETTTVATLLCVLLGLPVAYLLARYQFRARESLDTLIDLPITIPPVVVGVALLLVFGRLGLIGRYLDAWGIQVAFTPIAVVLAQLVMALPLFVKTARAGFESIDPRFEQAARVLGAAPSRVFWTVAVPLARPSLIAGVALAWARALSEFGATITFAGNLPGHTQTLSLAVMAAMESDLDTAVAVSLLSLALGLSALLCAKMAARRWGIPGERRPAW